MCCLKPPVRWQFVPAATGSSHTQQTSMGWTSGRVLHLSADARWPRAPRRRGGTAAPGAAGVLLLRGRIGRGHKAPPPSSLSCKAHTSDRESGRKPLPSRSQGSRPGRRGPRPHATCRPKAGKQLALRGAGSGGSRVRPERNRGGGGSRLRWKVHRSPSRLVGCDSCLRVSPSWEERARVAEGSVTRLPGQLGALQRGSLPLRP